MKIFTLVLLFCLTATLGIHAADLPELKAIESRYDVSQFAKDEALRQKYVLELAALRWKLARGEKDGWQAVDAEIAKYPGPKAGDDHASASLRNGKWISPRHDYVYSANGTWLMDPESDNDPDATHGTWSFHGNLYTEAITDDVASSYTVILLDKDHFIYLDSKSKTVFYERRPGKVGWPLRRDD